MSYQTVKRCLEFMIFLALFSLGCVISITVGMAIHPFLVPCDQRMAVMQVYEMPWGVAMCVTTFFALCILLFGVWHDQLLESATKAPLVYDCHLIGDDLLLVPDWGCLATEFEWCEDGSVKFKLMPMSPWHQGKVVTEKVCTYTGARFQAVVPITDRGALCYLVTNSVGCFTGILVTSPILMLPRPTEDGSTHVGWTCSSAGDFTIFIGQPCEKQIGPQSFAGRTYLPVNSQIHTIWFDSSYGYTHGVIHDAWGARVSFPTNLLLPDEEGGPDHYKVTCSNGITYRGHKSTTSYEEFVRNQFNK